MIFPASTKNGIAIREKELILPKSRIVTRENGMSMDTTKIMAVINVAIKIGKPKKMKKSNTINTSRA